MRSKRLSEKIRKEFWGFCALIGLLCTHSGIVLTVFALKDVTSHPGLLKALGIFLIVMGVVATLSSWYFHRQMREKRPMFPCCARVCCVNYEEDLLERSRYDRERSTRRRGHLERDKSVKEARLPTTSGFSTPEFRIFTDFLKTDSHRVTQGSSTRNNNTDVDNVQNKKYISSPTKIHPEQEKHVQMVPTITK